MDEIAEVLGIVFWAFLCAILAPILYEMFNLTINTGIIYIVLLVGGFIIVKLVNNLSKKYYRDMVDKEKLDLKIKEENKRYKGKL